MCLLHGIEDHTYEIPTLQFLAGSLNSRDWRRSRPYNQQNTVAEIGNNRRIRDGQARRRVENDPIEDGCDTI